MEAMARYVAGARASETTDVSQFYVRSVKDGAWRLNGAPGDPTLASDPLARRLNGGALGAPDHFVAGGDRNSAGAIWLVRDDIGQAVGHYRGFFSREGGSWGIMRLEVVEGGAEPAALAPFCGSPGDIEQFLATHDENGHQRAVSAVPSSSNGDAEATPDEKVGQTSAETASPTALP